MLFLLPFLVQWDSAVFEYDDNLDYIVPWYAILKAGGKVFGLSNSTIIPNSRCYLVSSELPGCGTGVTTTPELVTLRIDTEGADRPRRPLHHFRRRHPQRRRAWPDPGTRV